MKLSKESTVTNASMRLVREVVPGATPLAGYGRSHRDTVSFSLDPPAVSLPTVPGLPAPRWPTTSSAGSAASASSPPDRQLIVTRTIRTRFCAHQTGRQQRCARSTEPCTSIAVLPAGYGRRTKNFTTPSPDTHSSSRASASVSVAQCPRSGVSVCPRPCRSHPGGRAQPSLSDKTASEAGPRPCLSIAVNRFTSTPEAGRGSHSTPMSRSIVARINRRRPDQ